VDLAQVKYWRDMGIFSTSSVELRMGTACLAETSTEKCVDWLITEVGQVTGRLFAFIEENAYLLDKLAGEQESGAELVGHLDLMVDEFMRIKALTWSNCEIVGLCDRAITNTKQHVPVIEQRDAALAEVDRLTAEVATLQSMVLHPGDGSCERCGSAPAVPVNLCDQCMDPEAARP